MMIAFGERKRRVAPLSGLLAFAGMVALAIGANFASAAEPDTTGGEAMIRRLSPAQYQHVIEDVFGAGLSLGGRFEPDVRGGIEGGIPNGLLSVGAGKVSVTATGLEQYYTMARTVATQVVDEKHRDLLIPCKPANAAAADDVCATKFLTQAGRLLYRRPLTKEETDTQVKAANTAATTLKSFYSGIAASLSGMLSSPQFLFRQETVEADPDHPGQYRLDGFSKASLLSFLLWDTSPNDQLLTAAEKGELNTEKGLTQQVDRLLQSPRLETGIRAFFSDMLQFDQFATLAKDATIYPKFTTRVIDAAQEQTLRTIVDLVLTQRGDYRDLYTTRKTFLTPLLGSVYGVPVFENRPNGSPDPWVPYEYAEGDPRSGLLAQFSFASLHSHPGRTSATLRGKALRQIILCQKVPDPPGDVVFTVVQDTKNPQYKTARDRLTAHRTEPTCAGCHKMMDPMGLALENIDSAGGYRATENGVTIDASGEMDGAKFTNAVELGKVVHDNPATPACLVKTLYSHAAGRTPTRGEADLIKNLTKSFADDGYRVTDLLRRIATSDALYRVAAPKTGSLDVPSKLASQANSK